ncbi:MAG: flagellar filament capping protein FliD [Ruminococcus sp.]|nr:flagellar filament capping protein FliD [Ruminococcus sp.]
MKVSADNSTTSTYSYSSSGLSGLASGVDTESMVKSMLSGIQSKIDSQNQKKTQLEWKQESYRDVISKINSFQSKYLDIASSNSLRLTSTYNKMTTESSSSAVKITAASSDAVADMNVQVAQLATATKLTTGRVGTGAIQMENIEEGLEKYFSTPEQNISFTVGDKTVEFNLVDDANKDDEGNYSISKMVDNINAKLSDEGLGDIKLELSDEGKIKVTESGTDAPDVTIGGSSNALSTLGLKAMTLNNDNGYAFESTVEAKADTLSTEPPASATVNVTLDGVTTSISIANGSKEDVLASFKEGVKKAFGSNVTIGDDGSITARSGQTLSISGDSEVIGVEAGACSRLTTGTKLSELGMTDYTFNVNGKSFEFDENATIADVIKQVNASDAGVKMSYNSLSDSFTLESSSTGEGFDINVSGGFADKFFGSATKTVGQNAIVNVDGVTVERMSNNFSINGYSIQARAVTGNYFDDQGNLLTAADGKLAAKDGTVDNAATLTATKNTDEIVKNIKSFVEDYNKLIEDLNKLTHETKSYKDYAPLTDEQKDEMSESEIKKWEEKSKTGLLSGDADINNFLNSMRKTLYSKADNGFSLTMFGIDSSSDWKDYGKLEIDEDKLKAALEEHGDDVVSTFTKVATDLNTQCKNAASTSLASPGTLVKIAGVKGKVSEQSNEIKSQMDTISDYIKRLQERYDSNKDRYWKQFNAMETALANMNSTSTYLSQMMGF